MRFIDLFAGIGGFHKALSELGHECVFASEINPSLRDAYQESWGIVPKGDIRIIVKNELETIPPHDILCAGFPCQPFSKAGKQAGLNDKIRGTLFDEIIKILRFRKPNYFILENVPFIAKHDNEATWNLMRKKLSDLGYTVGHRNYSPHYFGIPQHRLRIFIVGSLGGLTHFDFNEVDKHKTSLVEINEFIDSSGSSTKKLPKEIVRCIKLWQKFIDSLPDKIEMPGFPIWSMEFGATYPYEITHPHRLTSKQLGEFRGNFGEPLKGLSKNEQLKRLPSYARVKNAFPDWKKHFIRSNRKFYTENEKYIHGVVNKVAQYESQSWQKLEWNVGRKKGQINDYIIQFRASGIRVKKNDFFPSLVCTNTQIPIIGWEERYLTKEEGLRLQSLEGVILPKNDRAAFKALGNSVNAHIVKLITQELIKESQPIALLKKNDSNSVISSRKKSSGIALPIQAIG